MKRTAEIKCNSDTRVTVTQRNNKSLRVPSVYIHAVLCESCCQPLSKLVRINIYSVTVMFALMIHQADA